MMNVVSRICVIAALFLVLDAGAAYLGDDVFVGCFYGNEIITIPRHIADGLNKGVLRESMSMTNSVVSFLSKCSAEDLNGLTNGTFFISAFYNRFGIDKEDGWALSICLHKNVPEGFKLVQFAILPNGVILMSRRSHPGEVYIIRHEPVKINEREFDGLIPGIDCLNRQAATSRTKIGFIVFIVMASVIFIFIMYPYFKSGTRAFHDQAPSIKPGDWF